MVPVDWMVREEVHRSPYAPGPGTVHSQPQVSTGEYLTTEGAVESRNKHACTESLLFKGKARSVKTVFTFAKACPSQVLEKKCEAKVSQQVHPGATVTTCED